MTKKITSQSPVRRSAIKARISQQRALALKKYNANDERNTLWRKLSSPIVNMLSWGWNSITGKTPLPNITRTAKQLTKMTPLTQNGRRRFQQSLSSATARLIRRRYILSYTKNTARAVFSKRWMRQAVRWDFVGVSLSKFWGKINSRPLPIWARRPIYEMWGRVFQCNMDEVREPLHTYPTLADFFARELKDGARPICPDGMASPVDGKVLACGEVSADVMEHIKGKTYSLSSFLGTKVEELTNAGSASVDEAAQKKSKLYHCVIYLHPGDYHRIHSPVECKFNTRKHFPGTLFPVNHHFLRIIPSLFALNERVVLMGEWDRGFFSMTAVGAYNVGSITVSFDEGVQTNQLSRDYVCPNLEYFSWSGVGSHAHLRDYSAEGAPIVLDRGAEVGQFHFGSTVVLVFEAEDFEFSIKPGEYVKMGQNIGC